MKKILTATLWLFCILLSTLFFINTLCCVEASSNNYILTYRIEGHAIPVKDINTFEPVTVELRLYGADEIAFVKRASIENVLKQIGLNMSINVKGVRIYYNCSEEAGRKPITYRLGPDGWYWVSIPVGPCIIRNVPLLLKLNGIVTVQRINNTALKVYMNIRFASEFENNISNYIITVKYPQEFQNLRNSSIEAKLSYIVVNKTAISGNEVIGFSPLYIVYPKDANDVKEIYEKKLLVSLYGVPLRFKMRKEYVSALERNISNSIIIAYAESNKFINLMTYIAKIGSFNFYREYLQPMYKGKPIVMNLVDFALRVIRHENITHYITYSPTGTIAVSSLFVYKNPSFPYNPDGEVIRYRWVYPLSFRGLFLKLNLSNGSNVWLVFWGDAEYGEKINPYLVEIGYFSPKTNTIDIKQILLFIAIVILPIIVIIYYFLKRRQK